MSSSRRNVNQRPSDKQKRSAKSGNGKISSNNSSKNEEELEIDSSQLETARVDPAPESTHSKVEVHQRKTGANSVRASTKSSYSREDLGEQINAHSGPDSGSLKDVFRLKDSEDICIALPKENIYTAKNWRKDVYIEYNSLKELESRCFSVIKTYGVVDVDGTPGLLLQYIPEAASSKSINNFVDNMTADSFAQLANIKYMLEEQNISPGDLQLLIDKKGRVYINDPMKINYHYDSYDGDDIADLMRAWANKQI